MDQSLFNNSPNWHKLAFFKSKPAGLWKVVRFIIYIQIQTLKILMATLCYFELKIFQILLMHAVLKAIFLQIWIFLAYLEHLK